MTDWKPELDAIVGSRHGGRADHVPDLLRKLDASGAKRIAVAPIPQHGLGEAINDRLRRAAADRS